MQVFHMLVVRLQILLEYPLVTQKLQCFVANVPKWMIVYAYSYLLVHSYISGPENQLTRKSMTF